VNAYAFLFAALPAFVHTPDPIASLPREVHLSHTVTIAPTGADGPSFPLAFESISAAAKTDRLKQDRLLGLHAVGGGVVLTLVSF
jgi:hypothetical protein